jgi:hypothetical protein
VPGHAVSAGIHRCGWPPPQVRRTGGEACRATRAHGRLR